MNLTDIHHIKALLARHGFHFSKSLGQNFLIQAWVPEQIARSCGAERDCGVLEIGPGIGPLTCQLAARAGKVAAVELDRRLLPILEETMAPYDNVSILHGDVLKLDLAALVKEQFPGLTPMVCANLPYNITTPVLTALMDSGLFSAITVMIQREVAARICAPPGSAEYGAFSLYCQYHAVPELLFEVPPECFLPAPKVTSAVVRLLPRSQPPVELLNEALFFHLVKAAFAQRRKTLLNALLAALGPRLDKEQLRALLEEVGLPPDIRGERLGICEFAALANAVCSRVGQA